MRERVRKDTREGWAMYAVGVALLIAGGQSGIIPLAAIGLITIMYAAAIGWRRRQSFPGKALVLLCLASLLLVVWNIVAFHYAATHPSIRPTWWLDF